MYLAKNSFKRGKMFYLQKQDSIKPTKILPSNYFKKGTKRGKSQTQLKQY